MASKSARRRGARPYNRDADDTQPVKSAVNAWIAAVAAQARWHRRENCSASRDAEAPAWALVLETRHLLTLTALCAADTGVSPATTVVPNPDPEELEAIAAVAPGVITVPLTSHGLFASLRVEDSPQRRQLIRRGWAGTFDVVWLDYCGTFGAAARAGRHRLQDLEVLFDQGLLAPPLSVLAVTFTTRGSTELFRGELMEYLVLLSDGLALRNGRRARLLGVVSYHNHIAAGRAVRGPPTMHTAVFAVVAQTVSGSSGGCSTCESMGSKIPAMQVDGLQYTSGDAFRDQILSRTRIFGPVSSHADLADQTVTPLWAAVRWTANAFSAGLPNCCSCISTHSVQRHTPADVEADAETQSGARGAVLVVESSPLLLVSNFLTASSSELTAIPVVHTTEVSTESWLQDQQPTAEMAVACARQKVQLEHEAGPSKEQQLESQSAFLTGGQLQHAQPNVATALKQSPFKDLVGAWLGYDALDSSAGSGGKPWRLEQLRRAEGPQPLWNDLHQLLSSEPLVSNRRQQGVVGRKFGIGVSLRYSSVGEVWEGAAVDSLLHGLSIAVARDGWRLESVGWVATYAVTSPRLACFVYLVKNGSSSPGDSVEVIASKPNCKACWEVRPISATVPVAAACVEATTAIDSAAAAFYTDEFSECRAIDVECFQEQVNQCTPIEELRSMHNPARGQYIDVCLWRSDTTISARNPIVGFVAYEFRGDVAHILILAVTRSARRCGVARRLVDAVLGRARSELQWSCRLEVREDNVAARAFYLRAGFVQVGTPHTNFYADGGAALKLSRSLLPPEGLQRARTSLWWYRQMLLPELQAAGKTTADVAVEVATRWRQLKQEQPEVLAEWERKAEEDRQRFEQEARVAAEALRVAQDGDGSALASDLWKQSYLRSAPASRVAAARCPEMEIDVLARACDTLVPPTVKQWQASWVGMKDSRDQCAPRAGANAAWDVARPKRPTTSAQKYQTMMEAQIGPSLRGFGVPVDAGQQRLTVLLHEPGFHYCIPMLKRDMAAFQSIELLCCAATDEVQAEELCRQQLPLARSGRDLRLTSAELASGGMRLVPGALAFVLLWEGGVASWDETFGPWLESVLSGPRAQTAAAEGGAGVVLWMSCESSAKPQESLSMLASLVLGGRGLGAAGWAWQELSVSSVHSDSRRYLVAGLQLFESSPVAG
eukprot:COSAG02_NODE_3882_length_6090_cov_26.657152_4_plen_1174_part_00